ncbi:tRNA (adenosine(37)-N6)-threonylcarbamoyltransferase complex dimerization subunit type 1 TsaB [Marinobacter sp. X15-166B]|uniref:tRNA (adenosine(37)-N6)-threonylcarbamoyltransferase complex dimerization subunit type 1 TsaB n=1 Tax=Marinobacter sp. X15-166B TaxID=1897620 RepID=UPI00085C9C8C|nr:tRNA (adenosine(37)-N6)-threonylcarbamoyltransferase complex dimerization subunit type 1 TsaB [Marinobacter sp. X15-166B]OEY68019.1 tRNA (adenosine(37)-N6)-threonylcarbamoyltransferase complex dimerization subunit type 1 TsaB [Marinobacter sp. X15-166B]
MKLLALDTSSEGCSAALSVDGVVSERFELAPRGHTRLLMPMVRSLLGEHRLSPADLDVLAFAAGPGSFTGLRIATGVIQGLAFGLELPVVPVSSLAVVAAEVMDRHSLDEGEGVAVAFDARMSEVYWGCFVSRSGQPHSLDDQRVCAPDRVSLPSAPAAPARWWGAGSGWQLQEQMPAAVRACMTAVDSTVTPRARYVAGLAEVGYHRGDSVPAAQAQPLYLRDTVTWKKLPGR